MPNPTRIELLPGEEVHVVALPDITPPPSTCLDMRGEWDIDIYLGNDAREIIINVQQDGCTLRSNYMDQPLTGTATESGFRLEGALPVFGTVVLGATRVGDERFDGTIQAGMFRGTIDVNRPGDDLPGDPPPDPNPDPDPDPDPVPDPEPGLHDYVQHFQTEIAKPGVIGYRSWRNSAEVLQDRFRGDNVGYDPAVDAAFSLIKGGNPVYELTQLRYRLPRRAAGDVWCQYEMMGDAVLLGPLYAPYGMKWFRWEDQTEQIGDKRLMTMNCGLGSQPHVYHRDGHKLYQLNSDGSTDTSRREVRRKLADRPGYDEQPGGSTRAYYRENEPHPTTFRWKANVWTRLTYHFNFAGQLLTIWGRRMDRPDEILPIVENYPVRDWGASWGFDVLGMWTHSTSRLKGDWKFDLPDARMFGRNVIVSSQPINF